MTHSDTLRLGQKLFSPTMAILACMFIVPGAALATDHQLTLDYSFERPEVTEVTIDGQVYHRLSMPNCPNGGNIGQPALPARGAHVLLPFGSEVVGIEIVPGERVSLGSGHLIEPVGPQFKLSEGPDAIVPPTPDPAIYASDRPFPAASFERVGTHVFRGYQILILKLQPVQYVPAAGELYYYPNLTVIVDTVDSGKPAPLFRGLPGDERETRARVDNPQIVESYAAAGMGGERSYDLLILTTPELVGAFEPLMNYHNANGIATEIHTSTDVGSTNPDEVRDYIQARYTLDGIDYVIIGGDDDVFPAKDLYVDFGDGSNPINNMPGDIYFTCLDGTWNYDGDSRWGEPTDGEGGGDVDLFAEVYIGRAAVGNATEATRFVNKTIWYLGGSHLLPEKVLLVGEHLGFGGPSEYAGDTLEELIDGSDAHGYTTVGIPSDVYEIDELFERDWPGHSWPQSELVGRINSGLHILNHLGHGADNYAMKLYNNDIMNLLTNDELCFVYSQTCSAGHFDGTDCWAEYMNIKTDYGAFAVIMNARYGFGAWSSTDGASQRYNRELWDAVYSAEEGKPQLGRANADSKEDNVYRINEDYMRWCCYEITLFGDPTATVMGVTGFTLDPDPGSQELCTTSGDEVVYTIEVSQLGDFDEVVTLTTDGTPAGADVSFSTNSLPPPFTTVMTVGNLGAAAPDEYYIVITGTSITLQRSTLVGLVIADDVPAQVTLTSPALGESGVPLLAELSWEPAEQARQYELEVASDAAFANVVYAATVAETTHTLSTPLETLSQYFWRVRALNACGTGDYSAVYRFTTVNMIRPVTYDMLNGEAGMYTYFDDSYDGHGDPTQPLSPLSDGLGELVDGVIATQNWGQDYPLYVGWVSIDPTITFHFDGTVSINTVILHVDDSNGTGGVNPPQDVTISMGGITLEFDVTDPPGGEPCALIFEDLDLEGDTMEITIADHSSSGSYMMLSEVEFYSDEQFCLGDLDGDGDVDLSDLAQLLSNYGTTSGANYEDGDLDGDGDVDLADLATLLAVYGTTCP